jgi:glycerophosphoryl diester phosphodiesterase
LPIHIPLRLNSQGYPGCPESQGRQAAPFEKAGIVGVIPGRQRAAQDAHPVNNHYIRAAGMFAPGDHIYQPGHLDGQPGLFQAFPFRGTGLTVPTLPEVLAWLPAGTGLAVEIKVADAADAAVAALAGAAVREEGLVSVVSFHERALDRVRELDVGIPTGLLLVPGDSFERGLTWVVEHGHAAVLPFEADLGADPEPAIRQARHLDRRVGCYVVNDPERMRQLAAVGIWGFVTDVPDVARATLGPAAG